MAEGEPNVSQAQSEIDAHLAAKADQDRKDLLDELLVGDGLHHESYKRVQVVNRNNGTSYERQIDVKGKPLNRDEQARRIDEASDYYQHLEEMANRPEQTATMGTPLVESPDYKRRLMESANEEALKDNAEVSRSEQTTEAHNKVMEEAVSQLEDLTKINEQLRAEQEDLKRQLAEIKQQLAELLPAKKELAPDQPRRVRNIDGVTERLVKYVDGSFAWEIIGETADVDSEQEQEAAEASEAAVQPEFNVGDEIRCKDLDGNLVEGKIRKIVSLYNEDYLVYEIEKEDGETVTVSYVYPKEGAVAGAGGGNGEGGEGNGRNLEDIEFPDDDEEQEGGDWSPEVPKELNDKLQEALNKYAEATAKTRNGYLGHLLHNSKFLVKIPLIGKLLKAGADKLNEAQDKKLLGPARAEYRQALIDVQDAINLQVMAQMEGQEQAEIVEAARKLTIDAAIQSEVALETKIAASRMEQSGKTNKFVNWWVQNDSLAGKFKKAGIVVGAGLTAGALIGLAGAPVILGTIAGAGIGGGLGNYITKRRANGIASEDGTATLAQRQAQEDIQRKAAYAKEQLETEGGVANPDDLIGTTEDRTGDETVGNRRRTKGLAGLGAAAGGIGASIGEAIGNGIENAPKVLDKPEAPAEVPAPTSEVPQIGGNISILDNEGGTEAIQRLYGATPDQARAIWDQVFSQFGTNPLDHSNVGGGMMPDIMQLGSGSYGWSHEGLLSTDMTNALNQAALSVMEG